MKKSEELKLEARSEDNDLKSLGLHNKALRENRLEKFENHWYDKLLEKVHSIQTIDDGQRFIFLTKQYGTITYYPKANKLLIHDKCKWKEKALNWIINNIINKS